MLIAYCRTSTRHQCEDRQVDILTEYGCEKFFTDKMSGGKTKDERPGLKAALGFMRPGDTLVVSELWRLARSTRQLIELSAEIEEKGCNLISLKEQIDTSTPTGKLFFHITAAIGEFQKGIQREYQLEGYEAAKRRGKKMGRPTTDKETLNKAVALYLSKEVSIKEIESTCNISRNTLYKELRSRNLM